MFLPSGISPSDIDVKRASLLRSLQSVEDHSDPSAFLAETQAHRGAIWLVSTE